MRPLLSLKNVSKIYGTGHLPSPVLHNVSLDISSGEFVAIVGQSGSGKSTLMNILGCLDQPTSGTYEVDSALVSKLRTNELASLRRTTFGFIFQSYHLIATATAKENVEIPAIYSGVTPRLRGMRAEELLNSLKLGDRHHYFPSQLSGGQQQRVSIARALINGSRVLLADEPTGALDSASGRDVMGLLKGMHSRGYTVILVTHSRFIADQADRVIELHDGRIVSDHRRGSIDQKGGPSTQVPMIGDGRAAITNVNATVKIALRSLLANRLRTILTLLGIIIGVSSIIAMLAIGTGVQNSIMNRITALGANLLVVHPNMTEFRGDIKNASAALVPADADAILDIPNITFAVPEMQKTVTIRHGGRDYRTTANGISPEFAVAKSWQVLRGEFISEQDFQSYASVAVLGETVAEGLFAHGENPIGQYVFVDQAPFQVIGVMTGRGAGGGSDDQDNVVLVPLTAGGIRLFGERNVRSITVQVRDSSQLDLTQHAIQKLLNERHRKQDTQVTDMSSVRESFSSTFTTMKLFLGSLAAISLLVGGIGIMNIMLVSVSERTREIGIRMATGARRSDILRQFLVESQVLSCVGGMIGIGCGFGFGALAQIAGLPVSFTPAPVLLALACSLLTGLVFGLLPAHKASKLHPAQALSAV
ncbi:MULTISPECIES: MacB family efflux pump subunit [unclassified Rhizobium]|uniref:MacB family efflux pump subunit n=1 Tax=unclassified Rhizobium TaxID=2613769 RepID=UPI001AD99F46|nr:MULTISPECIES: MacB family efflux pump subunit [unclassified Rhizobium]MBO9102356.1 MacB family efflux pump subunit [Rhizobium sp. L58/93]MBO9172397.1 MacB family efflux pump subunit [Rhizobium sp. L245/93]QXZ88234.1 MacB family efflux pump subunit [Rhizobium sp. K1/93]QXZ94205.1 MacB family efflux pump subunit [Rhizobium sp. K15/93]QYA05697.1 MacB family efflux pump subunit [Rhizobium sp. B21/90]